MNPLPIVPEDLPLLQILNTFQEGRSHIAIVCRRKPGFSFVTPKSSLKPYGSGSSGKEEQIDSDMEKGESTAEQSLLRSLFYSKKDKEQKGDGLLTTAAGSDARISRTSLREQYLDEDYPVGVITLEDVLEGMYQSSLEEGRN